MKSSTDRSRCQRAFFTRGSHPRSPSRRRLSFEHLEGRELLSISTATFDSAGYAFTQGDWSRWDNATAVSTDSEGNVYQTGSFYGTVDFDPGPGVNELTNRSNFANGFVAKYSVQGSLLWVHTLTSLSSTSALEDVAVAADGSIYVVGEAFADAQWDENGPALGNPWRNTTAVLAKFSPQGELQWSRLLAGNPTSRTETPLRSSGTEVVVGGDGRVHAGGDFEDVGDFDPGPGTSLLGSAGTKHSFVSTFESNGDFVIAEAVGGADLESLQSMAVDRDGRIWLAISFKGTADFDPGPAVAQYSGDWNTTFLGTYDASGAFVRGDTIAFAQVNDLEAAPEGGVYATGGFWYSTDFAPGTDSAPRSARGIEDLFLARYNANGALLWVDTAGGANSDLATAIDLTPSGKLVVTGQFTGDVDFDPGPESFVLSSQAGGSDVFVAQFSPDGTFNWAGAAGGIDPDSGQAVAVAPDGRIAVTGIVTGEVRLALNPTSPPIRTAAGTDLFFAEWDSDLKLQNATSFGNAEQDSLISSVVDRQGNVLSLGRSFGAIDLDPGAGSFVLPMPKAGTFTYAQKLGPQGELAWGWWFEPGVTPEQAAVSDDGSFYVAGSFVGTVDLDPGPGTWMASGGTAIPAFGTFVEKFDADGHLVWARAFSGAGIGTSAIAASKDGVVLAGLFSGRIDFDPGPETEPRQSGQTDWYLLKLDPQGELMWVDNDHWYSSWTPELGSLVVAGDGTIYLGGSLNGTADLDPSDSVAQIGDGKGTSFVARYDSTGSFDWVRQLPSLPTLGIAPDGGVYVGGEFSTTSKFDPQLGALGLVSHGTSKEVYLARISATGEATWFAQPAALYEENSGLAATPSGGVVLANLTRENSHFIRQGALSEFGADGSLVQELSIPSAESLVALGVTANGRIISGGTFTGTADLDPGPGEYLLQATGSQDAFLWSFTPPQGPSAVDLADHAIPENSTVGTVVGQLHATDPDACDALTYRLVAGEGADDNRVFTLTSDGRLVLAAGLDYETKSSLSIRVRVTDSFGLRLERPLTVTVTDTNLSPTAINLSGDIVTASMPVGTVIGVLSATDNEPPAESFTFSLVAGAGDSDNSRFAIVGHRLITAAEVQGPLPAELSVRVRVTDAGGLSYETPLSLRWFPDGDMPGLYAPDSSSFYLRDLLSSGVADRAFVFGVGGRGWIPLSGDWDGDGVDTAGLYDPEQSRFYLTNRHGGGAADISFVFGIGGRGWQPLVGDWDGDGRDSIGVYQPDSSIFFFNNRLGPGDAEQAVQFGVGNLGWKPIVGNWDGQGGDGFGFYEPATSLFFLKNAHTSGPADETFQFGVGNAGWQPLVGDWDGRGGDGVGFYVPQTGQFFLKNAHLPGAADYAFAYGLADAGWQPLAGHWRQTPGVTPAAATPAGESSPAFGDPSALSAYDSSTTSDSLLDLLAADQTRRRGRTALS